jgi:peptidoglycan hydrolase-like protein with peptidoglycan-binding domain
VDGIYGPNTVAAIQKAQAAAGIPQTGIVDPATEQAISQQLAAKGKQQSAAIVALQGALKTRGFYNGPIDGIWGSGMESAVKAFQASVGLPQTGAIDPPTLQALLIPPPTTTTSTSTTA